MLKSVLVAYDGSASSRAALEHACWLASLSAGKVYITFVVELPGALPISTAIMPGSMELMTPMPTALTSAEIEQETERLRQQGLGHLEEAGRIAARWGLHHETSCEVGFAFDKIRAQAEAVDLLALGKYGAAHAQPCIGRIAGPIARHVPEPVLLASPRFTRPGELILIFNGGEKSHRALTLGTEIAMQARIPLAVVTLSDSAEENARLSDIAVRYLNDHNAQFTQESLSSRDGIDAALRQRIQKSPEALVIMGAVRGTRLMAWLTGDASLSIIGELSNPMIVCSH